MTAGSGAARRLPADQHDVQTFPQHAVPQQTIPQHAVLQQPTHLPEQAFHPAAPPRSAKGPVLLLLLLIVAIGLVALNLEEPAVAIFTGLE